MGFPPRLTANSVKPTFKGDPKKHPTILANIIHTSHVEIHVDFSFTKNVMYCGPKPLSCKLKVGTLDTLNQ